MIEASILRAAETERLHAVAAVEAAAVAAERARAERARADIAVAAAERLAQWEESAPRQARAAAAESRLAAAQWAATQATSAGSQAQERRGLLHRANLPPYLKGRQVQNSRVTAMHPCR